MDVVATVDHHQMVACLCRASHRDLTLGMKRLLAAHGLMTMGVDSVPQTV